MLNPIKLYFNYGRTALDFALKQRGFKIDDEILVPDYICSSVIKVIEKNLLKIKYYGTTKDLKPDWDNINMYLNKKTKLILMVHFFGIPQDIKKFMKFSLDNNLILIEDNSHGFKGCYQNKTLGTFGDIGISSPRKMFNLFGGILYTQSNELNNESLKEYNLKKYNSLNNYQLHTSEILKLTKNKIRRYIKKRYPYENSEYFRNQEEEEKKIIIYDQSIEKSINRVNWEKYKIQKYRKIKKILDILKQNNLEPIYKNYNEQLNPWCIPFYTKSHSDSIEWFEWGWKNGYEIFSWPTLPKELIKKEKILKKWQNLICIGL
tara:strand:- start:175 stop:1131 length:957 start_codon:yes stop_codon:yes gene_type:complete